MADTIPFPRARPDTAPGIPLPASVAEDDADPITKILRSSGAYVPPAPTQQAPAPTASPPPRDPIADAFASVGLSPKQEAPATQSDGFFTTAAKSALRGVVESSQELAAGTKAATTSSVAEQAKTLPPEQQDDVTRLLQKPISSGWTEPNWWAAHIGHGVGGAAPGVAAGLAGGALGAGAGGAMAGPPGAAVGGIAGGIAGFGGEAALQQIVPAFQRIKILNPGISDDAALSQAMVESGVVGAFSAAMGLAPGGAVFGRTIENALKRPIAEALTQIGVIQPTIGLASQQAVTGLEQGRTLTPDEALTGYITNVGSGVTMVGGHAALRAATGKETFSAGGESGTPVASPEAIEAGFKSTQLPRPGVESVATPAEIKPENVNAVAFTIRGRGVKTDAMEAHEWMAHLRETHGDEALSWLRMPAYLEGPDGKIRREDLGNFVAAQAVDTATSGDRVYMTTRVPIKAEPTEIRVSTDSPSFAFRPGMTRDLQKTLLVGDLRNVTEDDAPLLAQLMLRKAQRENFEHVSWQSDPLLDAAMKRLSELHGVALSDTKLEGGNLPVKDMPVSPVVASNVRQGFPLFTEKPGVRIEELSRKDSVYHGSLTPGIRMLSAGSHVGTWRAATTRVKEALGLPDESRPFGMAKTKDQQPTAYRLDFRPKKTVELTDQGEWHTDEIIDELFKKGVIDPAERAELNRTGDVVEMLQKKGYDAIEYKNTNEDLGKTSYITLRDVPVVHAEPLASETQESIKARQGAPTAGTKPLLPTDLRPAARRSAKIIDALRKAMGMKVPIKISIEDSIPGLAGQMRWTADGFLIRVNLSEHETSGAEGLFATMAHEFGHVVMYHFFDKAPMGVKNAIVSAFDRWRQAQPAHMTMDELGLRRSNAISNYYRQTVDDTPVLSMTPERQRYWNGFEEWFAEQTARWATRATKPLSVVDKFFQSLGRRVLSVIQKFRGQANLMNVDPVPEMRQWLDSLLATGGPFAADTIAGAQMRSQRENQAALNAAGESGVHAVPETSSTGDSRSLLDRVLGRDQGAGKAIAAGADRFNRFYQWMISMPQLAQLNPHIAGLQRYKELVSVMHVEKVNMQNEGEATLRAWRALRGPQSEAVSNLIDDYMNMVYRTPAEVKGKVARRPSQAEFAKMVADNKVNDKGIAVFQRIVADFDRMLDRYQSMLEAGAHEIEDPVESAKRLESIAAQVKAMRQSPYFPAMRFGNYTITVRNKAGSVVHFETTGSARSQKQIHQLLEQSFQRAGEDVKVRSGYMYKDAAPMVGMPPGLLTKIADKLTLSPTQKAALDELKFEYMPAQSFAHRFQRKKLIPGYSQEFMRAYASYIFHASSFFTKAKYVDQLRDVVRGVRDESASMGPDMVKRDQIARFMSEHLGQLLDPKPEFMALRSFFFHWALGFSPAAATLNLSQTLLGTYPYLAQHFGDFASLGAMGRASSKLSTFYSKARLIDTTDPELKALREGAREGVISESMASALAATADGRVLSKGFGGNRSEKMWDQFGRSSSFFFDKSEQYNRRVAFRAAWDLAMKNPETKHVADMVKRNGLQYQRLRDAGWTEQEAAAFVTAKDAVEATQYVYAQYARPKFMTGKYAAPLFLFKSFTQNTLFFLWNNPGAAARHLLMLGAAGGLMGMPGAEDINGIIRAIAFRLFGKDFDLNDSVREFVHDVLHGGGGVQRPGDIRTKEGGIRPDVVLHGLSRVGYGFPALADYLGELAGHEGHVPVPVVDRHANIGLGNILPVEPGRLFAPEITGITAGAHNVPQTEVSEVQRASGAAFGFAFALYKFMTSGMPLDEKKRWEGILPTSLRNLSKAFRYGAEGREKTASGATTVKFDVNDPEQMMEIIAQGMGYRPERMAEYWDRQTALKEASAFWDIRRQYLMRAAWTAKSNGDTEEYTDALAAIRKFNGDLPPDAKAKAITGDALASAFKMRATTNAKTEAGIPLSRSDIPLLNRIRQTYPLAGEGERQRVP